jgi:outer membrane protein assembly factor BamB
VQLGGTLDSSPIYLAGVTVHSATHNVFFVTTTYGKTLAIDADTGTILWKFVPSSFNSLAGTYRITNATPAADPARRSIYAASPDGYIRKLRIADGAVLWKTAITLLPAREKITSSLNVAHGLVYATTGGYNGDQPPYQGHVVTLNSATGAIEHVWNSLCAARHKLIDPTTCSGSDSAIWSRNGAALDPVSGEIVVATGNGPYNGSTFFGDSVAFLSSDAATLDRTWTPKNQQTLNDQDLDLGSTSPGFLPGNYGVQGGKDGKLKLLSLSGTPMLKQTLNLPNGDMMFSEPAIWQSRVFISTAGGTVAYTFDGSQLVRLWSNGNGGTSPVVAGGMLYVAGFDGQLHVYVPQTGHEVTTLPTGDLHWQSPIVTDGRIAVGEGDANNDSTTGVLDIFRLP